jgi:membrane dipeptidase
MPAKSPKLSPSDALTRARELLAAHPLIDGHNDLAWELRGRAGYDLGRADIATFQPDLQTDIPRLRAGGLGGQFWSVYVPSSLRGGAAVTATLEQIDFVHTMIRRYPDTFALARCAAEVEEARARGRIASLLGAEGGHSIDCSLGVLRALFALGVRYMTLTHNDNVPWADSATDEPAAGGLSRFGEEVVREMNRLGMLVDISHVAPATMRDALRVTAAPVIFSHSSARALCDVPRNVPDDMLAGLARNGGVCMVTFVPQFISPRRAEWARLVKEDAVLFGVDPADRAASRAFMEQKAREHPRPAVTVAEVADHVDHVREVAGAAHVGIGGDYDGTLTQPEDLADVAGYPRLIGELLNRGWSEDELSGLTRGNILRVMRDADAVSRNLSRSSGPSLATIAELDGTEAADGGSSVASPP